MASKSFDFPNGFLADMEISLASGKKEHRQRPAMENGWTWAIEIDYFPIKTFIYKGFSMAIFSMIYLKLVEQNGDV